MVKYVRKNIKDYSIMKTRYKILIVLIAASLVFGIVKYGQRGMPVYDAIDFLGAGQGDTVSAINLAITTAAANNPNGAVVYIPEGLFGVRTSYLSGTAYRPVGIIGASNITLRGAGASKTRIIQDAPPIGATFDTSSFATNTHFSSIVRCTNCTNFVIEDLTINGTLSRQINHTSNPYTNPQDGLGNDSLQTDGIYFIGGKHNIIRNVHMDSVQGYGFRIATCYQATIDGTITSNAINGGVYFAGICNGSVLQNSLITNNNCDNVRLRAGNITVINNEISWSKFNPSAIVGGGANFAGLYVENGVGSITVGISAIGNRIHDNSSYAVDCFNIDTVNWTFAGQTVSVRSNTMYHNANGGVQVQMQWMTVDGNDIFDNGQDSLGISDPASYSPYAVITHGLNSNGLSVTNNVFRTTSPPGKQLYGIMMGSPTAIPIFSVHGNTQYGGLDMINVTTAGLKATSPYNTYYGNMQMDSNKVNHSSWQTDQLGDLIMYNYAPGLNGVASGTLSLAGDLDAQLYGGHLGNTTRAFYIGDIYTGSGPQIGFKIGEYGAGSGVGQRTLGFWDFNTSTLRGAMNAAGDLYWGTAFSGTNYSFAVHQPGATLSSFSPSAQVEIVGKGDGATNFAQPSALQVTLNAGYTGNGYPTAIIGVNKTISTGKNLGGAGNTIGDYGVYAASSSAATNGGNIGLYAYGAGSLKAVGVIGDATFQQLNGATTISIGVLGHALRSNASAIEVGGAFIMSDVEPTFASAALLVDNSAESVPVALFRVNGVTKIQIDASGNLLPGAATTTDLGTAAIFYRDLYISHEIGETAIGVSSGLGTNVSSLTPAGNDINFQLTAVTSGNVTGTVGLVAFGRTWGATPKCVISVANATTGAAVAAGYIGLTATSATSMTMVGSLTGAGTYVFNCHCGQ